MTRHDWEPSAAVGFELDASNRIVEGWARCRRCGSGSYVARHGGEPVAFHVGGPLSGSPVDPDCDAVLTAAVMSA